MSIPAKKRKPDAVLVSQVWLHIFKMLLDGLEGQPNKEQLAAYIFEVLMNGKRHFKHKENATIDDVFEYLWREAREHKIDIDKLIE